MIFDFTAELTNKQQVAPNVWHLFFKISNAPEFNFQPGQYVLLKVDGKFRQYSIASSTKNPQQFELIVEYFEQGLASGFFDQLKVGQTAEFKGPAGVFILRENENDKIFFATGTGIAPIKSMIETHLERGLSGNVHLYFGVRTMQDVYLYDHFVSMAQQHKNFNFTICLSQETEVDKEFCDTGRINTVFDKYMNDNAHVSRSDVDFYVCGSKKAVEGLKQYLFERGAIQDHVFFERFD